MKRISIPTLVVFCASFLSLSWGQNQDLPGITGKGTTNFIPRFTSRTTIGNSRIFASPSISPAGWLNLVGIGTTNPDGTLNINVGPNMNAFRLGDGGGQSFLVRDTVPGLIDIQTFSSDLAMQCCDGNNVLMFAASEGHLGIGTGNATNIITVKQNSATEPIADAWTTYSSARWKTNIQPIDNPLDKVEHLRGVAFDWKANGKHDIGLVAEEVAMVVPEVVGFERNGKAQSVDYGRLTALLLEAIKEQQAQIRELKGEIEKLSRQTSDTPALTSTGSN
jgi:hypothetical protein